MSSLDRLLFRTADGQHGVIEPVGSSLTHRRDTHTWLRDLEPWLRAGDPPGRCYLNFGQRAALIRWHPGYDPARRWELADVLVGPVTTLTDGFALRLPLVPERVTRIPRGGRLSPVTDLAVLAEPEPSVMVGISRSREVTTALSPLLSRVLAGDRELRMPWATSPLPEAILLGLVTILAILHDWQISFLTYAVNGVPAQPGVLVYFRPLAVAEPPHPRYRHVADVLTGRYAEAGAGDLHRMLDQHGVFEPGDQGGRIARLLAAWPSPAPSAQAPRAATAPSRSAPPPWSTPRSRSGPAAEPPARRRSWTVPPAPASSAAGPPRPPEAPEPPIASAPHPASAPAEPAALVEVRVPTATAAPGALVTCPVCLSKLDWGQLELWRFDRDQNRHVRLEIPVDAGQELEARLKRGAVVRCRGDGRYTKTEHYLPADYGSFGPPVILGFIGASRSGKTHLLAAMVGEIARGGLEEYGLHCHPVDPRAHTAFVAEQVRPLFSEAKVLKSTQEKVVSFADAFVLTPVHGGLGRPIALFDVAGADLLRVDETQQFLDIADGLVFTVDPTQLHAHRLGDSTFNTALDLLRPTGRLPARISAAIVVNKADLLRFEDPIAQWLRSDSKELDAAEIIRESADVFAYLDSRGARAWTRPYGECARATLHVVSSTGGAEHREGGEGSYPRGVTPCRVLRPLVALLAMTGVLTGVEAGKVGI
jgi:Double-GTPase 2